MKCLLEEATPEEQQQVEAWRKATAANEAYYEGFRIILAQNTNLPQKPEQDASAAWHQLQHRIHKNEKKQRAFPWLRLMVLFVLLAGIGFVSYRLIHKSKVQKLVVQAGDQVVKDTLPDRSVVSLNRHSLITYTSEFSKEHRTVYLVGEAYFDIEPDKARPFVVRVNNIEVRVSGTQCNIRSRAGTTEVIVQSGHVQVTKQQKTLSLKAREKVTIRQADTVLVKKAEKEQLYHWYHSRQFVCSNTPLYKLVTVLNEAYDVRIIIGRKSLRNLPLTVTFEYAPLDQLLDILSKTLDLTITRTDGGIVLK